LPKLIGRKCDAQGKIYSDSGKVIGTAELVSVDDRDEGYSGLFEDFPNAVVDAKGNIVFEGQVVGKLIEGDSKKLAGKKIDKDGEIVDKIGNVLGKAERWTEPDEPQPEVIDMSALAGKRVSSIPQFYCINLLIMSFRSTNLGMLWTLMVKSMAVSFPGILRSSPEKCVIRMAMS
jgi:hypothetical protein